jgi:hypothetical protein
MSASIELVHKHEPVLCFSKDGQGNPERFFPIRASHYVHACGLRRKAVGWEQPPGQTLLWHLSWLLQPQECYLAYAAGEVEDGQILLELLDQGLELHHVPGTEVPPGDGDAASDGLDRASSQGTVMPRLLAGRERAAELERRLAAWGGVSREPVPLDEQAALWGGAAGRPSETALAASFGPSLSTAPPDEPGGETPPLEAEWVIPQGFAALPDSIRTLALQKYAPYRDWVRYPPIYHSRVSRDGPYQVLQYWFLYPYNDWAAHGGHNDHEGDWEVIFVLLDDGDQPQHVAYSRHVRIPMLYEPLTAPWSEVERVGGTHPVVYVGCGSHASYLEKGQHLLLGRIDHAQGNDVAIGPGTGQPWGDPVRLTNKRWNQHFAGRWGALVKSWLGFVIPGTEGPTGPAHKGDKWHHPARWAGLL